MVLLCSVVYNPDPRIIILVAPQTTVVVDDAVFYTPSTLSRRGYDCFISCFRLVMPNTRILSRFQTIFGLSSGVSLLF